MLFIGYDVWPPVPGYQSDKSYQTDNPTREAAEKHERAVQFLKRGG
jgi:hypothetical protein